MGGLFRPDPPPATFNAAFAMKDSFQTRSRLVVGGVVEQRRRLGDDGLGRMAGPAEDPGVQIDRTVDCDGSGLMASSLKINAPANETEQNAVMRMHAILLSALLADREVRFRVDESNGYCVIERVAIR